MDENKLIGVEAVDTFIAFASMAKCGDTKLCGAVPMPSILKKLYVPN